MTDIIVKKTLHEYLDDVDYSYLNSSRYKPSSFALQFSNFIKLVNGEEGEANKTPPMHLAMLDKIATDQDYIVNVCFRGSGKALSLDTELPSLMSGHVTIGNVQVGDYIFGEDGKPTQVIAKSDVFNKSMYKITLKDKRELKVSIDHINVLIIDGTRVEVTTDILLQYMEMGKRVFIPLAQAVERPYFRTKIDPYPIGMSIQRGDIDYITNEYLYNDYSTRDLLLEGILCRDSSVRVLTERCAKRIVSLVQSLGYVAYMYLSPCTEYYIVEVDKFAKEVEIDSVVRIPNEPSQCIAVDNESKTFLAGDYIVTHNTTLLMEYMTLYLAVMGELPGLGRVEGMMYISDTVDNGVKNARQNIEYRYENSEFLHKWIKEANFTEKYLEFRSVDNKRLGVKMYGATAGIRGSKIFGKRPPLAIGDDVLPEGIENSPTTLRFIKDVLYKGVNHALDPTRRKFILCGTPFSKEDPLVEAVESGTWAVNVWPVCKEFPVEENEFQGAWPDRFSYDYLKKQYDLAATNGRISSFNQELMLKIAAEEERLVQEGDIRWYSVVQLLEKKGNFNFYITTDFATSDKQSADYSVISVWAYNNNGDWFWVDGICARQTMDKNINDLFRLVTMYTPQEVGIEVTGQQGAFIRWLQDEMMSRNIWFNLATHGNGNKPGIRPTVNKLSRFNMVLPWFKAGKMYFPNEMKTGKVMTIFMEQLKFITADGIRGKDDCIDTVSMLIYLNPWKPSVYSTPLVEHNSIWEEMHQPETISSISSYIV